MSSDWSDLYSQTAYLLRGDRSRTQIGSGSEATHEVDSFDCRLIPMRGTESSGLFDSAIQFYDLYFDWEGDATSMTPRDKILINQLEYDVESVKDETSEGSVGHAVIRRQITQ